MPAAVADPNKAGRLGGSLTPRGLGFALSLLLGASGCGLFEGQHPGLRLRNDRNEPVTMSIEGLDLPVSVTAGSRSLNTIPLDTCKGTAVVVTTSEGGLLNRFEQQACPDAIVRASADGTITLTEQ